MSSAQQDATRLSLRFRQKILLLPGIAAVALLLTLILTVSLGRTNEVRLRTIRDGYYPSVQLSRSLQEDLSKLQSRRANVAAHATALNALVDGTKVGDIVAYSGVTSRIAASAPCEFRAVGRRS